jgi:polyisoprenoid-binding protein YceI
VFQEARLNIPVKKMVSGDEKLDDNMYEALKADDHPEISFRLLTDSIISFSRDSMKLNATGMLSVAGKEKEIDMTLLLIQSSTDTLTIEGSKELLMSEFGIDPPSMMLGLLKTDDKIVIHFQLHILPQR